MLDGFWKPSKNARCASRSPRICWRLPTRRWAEEEAIAALDRGLLQRERMEPGVAWSAVADPNTILDVLSTSVASPAGGPATWEGFEVSRVLRVAA